MAAGAVIDKINNIVSMKKKWQELPSDPFNWTSETDTAVNKPEALYLLLNKFLGGKHILQWNPYTFKSVNAF